MKHLVFIGFLIILFGCEKTEPLVVDLCPTCTSLVEINDEVWETDLRYALFQLTPGPDTFFTLEFQEVDPVHDQFEDAVLFWRVPYEVGKHQIDSFTTALWNTSASLIVFEGGNDSPDQFYESYPDSASYFDITLLDKKTGKFEMNFQLYFHPQGIPGSSAGNSTYPNLIEFKGSASGKIEPE